jgi:WD40 repeat protein
LRWSPSGDFFATSGQGSNLEIWQLQNAPYLVETLQGDSHWIDSLEWSPDGTQLAFNCGCEVRIWQVENGAIKSLTFNNSSVLDLTWHPSSQYLAAAGRRGIKIWNTLNWKSPPWELELTAAATAITWSNDGFFLAASSFDNTVAVWPWGTLEPPWVMQGFPGKIRCLTWSDFNTNNAYLLACASADGIVVWRYRHQDNDAWETNILEHHRGTIQDLTFRPSYSLLSSVDDNGWLYLWQQAQKLIESKKVDSEGFSCISWDPLGKQLVTGSRDGTLHLWLQSQFGLGFG